MNSILMSSVINDVMLTLEGEFNFIRTNIDYIESLFNRVQLEIATLSECIQFGHSIRMPARLSEGGLVNIAVLAHDGASDFTVDETVTGGSSGATAVVVTVNASSIHVKTVVGTFQNPEVLTGGTSGDTANTTALIVAPTTRTIIVVPDNITVSTSDDFYNGYLAKNSDAPDEAFVTDSVASSGSEYQTLHLSHEMPNMLTGDVIELEKLAKFVELPWYIIRPFIDGGVHWGDQPLVPISESEMKDLYGNVSGNSITGTPSRWAMVNQQLWIYPQPVTTKLLRIDGHRRPADIVESKLTSAGSSRGDTIVDTKIPLRQDDYYQGMEVIIKSGSSQGEIRCIDEYDSSTSTFYFKKPFSAQIATDVEYEMLSPLPEEYRSILQDYIAWQLSRGNRDIKQESDYYEAEYRNRLPELKMIAQRRQTSNLNSVLSRNRRGTRRFTITSTL